MSFALLRSQTAERPAVRSSARLRDKAPSTALLIAGIVGTSLLAATFSGCQSSGPNPMQASGPFGPGGQQPGYGMGGGQNGFGNAPNGMNPGFAANGQQQAFLNETQRIGTQQSLSLQDVVAMSRSGVPDTQVAIAIQQRGANLRNMPGAAQALAQQGVNPAVLNGGQPAGGAVPVVMSAQQYPGQSGMSQGFQGQSFASGSTNSQFGSPAFGNQVASTDLSAGLVPSRGGVSSMSAAPGPAGVPSAPATTGNYAEGFGSVGGAAPGSAQGAGYEVPAGSTGMDAAPASNGMPAGQSWRPMSH